MSWPLLITGLDSSKSKVACDLFPGEGMLQAIGKLGSQWIEAVSSNDTLPISALLCLLILLPTERARGGGRADAAPEFQDPAKLVLRMALQHPILLSKNPNKEMEELCQLQKATRDLVGYIRGCKGIAEGIQAEAASEFEMDVKARLDQMASSLGKTIPEQSEDRRVTSENLLPPSEEPELTPVREIQENSAATEDENIRGALLCVHSRAGSSSRRQTTPKSSLCQATALAVRHQLGISLDRGQPFVGENKLDSVNGSGPGGGFGGGGRDQKQKLLVSMVYSLIRQLCRLVPPEIGKDFEGLERFAQLDGSPQSIPIALALMKRLIEVSPGLLICVIDGLQLLDYGELVEYGNKLLGVLTGSVQDHVVKLLVTTSGSFTSGSKLGATARLDCSVAPGSLRGGAVPGGRSMHNLRL
ncbi:hypothetical protein PG991_000007 [Apiospora marii]|uniref:Uncharacterized protein n=1 Tax=Apiospora marii TaxID=335849 RepID=A0ABR1T2U8_9PEZI